MAIIEITDNSQEFINAMKQQALKALTECGMVAEGYAKGLAAVDTGALRNSITFKVVDNECYIGTNQQYAPYVEFGTGVYYAGGRKTPWVYKGSDGEFHMTNGQRAQPFLKPAVADHTEEYRQIIEDNLRQ